jgi:hypothetical protein
MIQRLLDSYENERSMFEASEAQRKRPAPVKRAFDTVRSLFESRQALTSEPPTPEELEAEAIDNGKRYGYQHDEREIQIFKGLYYSPERQEWLAQFQLIAHPDSPYINLSHAQVLSGGRTLLEWDTKPSQCLKASSAFCARLDRAARKLEFED